MEEEIGENTQNNEEKLPEKDCSKWLNMIEKENIVKE